MQKVLTAIAAISGLFFAYVDSRPTWDDTGILVGAIVITCGGLSLIGYQRPWLLALLVGMWIPLYEMIFSHGYGSIIALFVAFIGAYSGWLLRRMLVNNGILRP
jgi:hypothetical protein